MSVDPKTRRLRRTPVKVDKLKAASTRVAMLHEAIRRDEELIVKIRNTIRKNAEEIKKLNRGL